MSVLNVEKEGKERQMEEEEEDEEEEEETLVLVELHGVIDSEVFAQESFSKFKVVALDSDRPVLQVENFIFSGEYEHTMGTAAFFEEEEKRLKCDPVFCKKPSRMLRYSCATNKKLTMKRVFISEKNTAQDTKEGVVPVTTHSPSDVPQPQEDVSGAVEEGAAGEIPTQAPQD